MKFLFIILFCCTSIIFSQEKAETIRHGNFKLRIVDIESNDGVIDVALSNSRNNYESREVAFRGITLSIKDNVAEHVFENIPFGEYAIKVYHDEDNDGELDTNFLGIPSEDYGFSNNASGSFGPADYEDAKFIFAQDNMIIKISLD